MFADHPDAYVEFLGCRYRGKAGIKRLYQGRFQQMFVKGRNGPVYGFLLDHAMLQDIVDVDESGTHAWVRMRALMSAGTHQSIDETHPRGHVQWWEGGVYENEYLKENGVWKLFRYRYFPFWHGMLSLWSTKRLLSDMTDERNKHRRVRKWLVPHQKELHPLSHRHLPRGPAWPG